MSCDCSCNHFYLIFGEAVCICMISCFSCVWLFATLWTVACQAPLSMGFCRQEYCSELPLPPPWDPPDPGIEPKSPVSLTLADGFLPSSTSWEAFSMYSRVVKTRGHKIWSLRFKTWLCHLPGMWSWAGYVTSLASVSQESYGTDRLIGVLMRI